MERTLEAIDETDGTELLDASSAAALRRVRALASLLDDGVEIPVVGVKVGIDPLLGLAPVSGDILSGVLSLYIPLESARLGMSSSSVATMLAEIGIDAAAGAVPLVGNVFDVFWRPNRRNVRRIEEFLGVDHEK